MIEDLSASLKALFDLDGVPRELAQADVVFDRPDDKFAPSASTLNLFLYDVREDVALRSNEPVRVPRPPDEVSIRPPAMRIACSYLVTAWPVGGPESALQEQRLLGLALAVLRGHPILPAQALQGRLKDPPFPVALTFAQDDDALAKPGEFWTAIGGRLRPSMTLRATIAIDAVEPAVIDAHVVTLHEVRVADRSAAAAKRTSRPTPARTRRAP